MSAAVMPRPVPSESTKSGATVGILCAKFQSVLCEHGGIERRRYRDAKVYAERTAGWTSTSAQEESDGAASTDLSALAHGSSGNGDATSARIARNKRQRRLRDVLQNDEWSSQPESRRVYPSDFPSKWNRYLYQDLAQPYASIEKWIEHVEFKAGWEQMDGTQRERCWIEERNCADVVKLLIADAACTPDKEQQRFKVETVFLLAHHPCVGLDSFLSLGTLCCSTSCGIGNLAEKTMKVFLYLNLIYTKYEQGEKAIFASKDSNERHCLSEVGWGRNPFRDITELLPHPEYMNLKSWYYLLATDTDAHVHLAENAMFHRFLLPKESDQRSAKSVEKDPMADIPALREFLKSMWKVLIICDMVFNDIGKTIDWEWCVLDALDRLFGYRGLMGKSWVEYELERSGYPEDQSRSGFGFCKKKT
ncbi:MAG: hypothetical protein M1820_003827 [Bogoriella megaspora]|nr:MAG: hypothetical protein M1820_003827 [Bogoriella megaspora]